MRNVSRRPGPCQGVAIVASITLTPAPGRAPLSISSPSGCAAASTSGHERQAGRPCPANSAVWAGPGREN